MADLLGLAQALIITGPEKVSASSRRIRGLFNRKYIFDTIKAVLVWEDNRYPHYYFPISDLSNEVKLEKSHEVVSEKTDGKAWVGKIIAGDKSTDRAIYFHESSDGVLAGLVRIEFKSIDHWFEEDSLIFMHPRDPSKRIETLPVSKNITVSVDSTVIAEASSFVLLLESNSPTLPDRYYLPPTSVNWEYLTRSKSITTCPYKGDAWYFDVTVNGKEYKDLIWWYKTTTAEAMHIAGMFAFYNSEVEIQVDGIIKS